VGRLVGGALKYPFLDTDALIEASAGCTIPDIFRDEGEEAFRDLETQVLQARARPPDPVLTLITMASASLSSLRGCSRCAALMLRTGLPTLTLAKVRAQELMPFKEVVVATGGGAVVRGVNWGYLHHGIVVWLAGAPELLAARAMRDGAAQRPMLAQAGGAPQARPPSGAPLRTHGCAHMLGGAPWCRKAPRCGCRAGGRV